jgi:putative DNA primase/helicase
LPENFFLVTKNTTDFITANLFGVRLATCTETSEGRRLDVARIKALTGQDTTSAALKYQNYFEFRSQAKLVLATNHAPQVPAGDDALWRRLKVLPFNCTVPKEKQIADLAEQLLKREGPGILRWAVLGCQAWLANRLDEPKEVDAAVSEYRSAEDVIQDFLNDCCVREPAAQVLRVALYAEYLRWAKDRKMYLMSKKKFATELKRLGIEGDAGDRFWFGVRLGQ